jgi:hypothetical protein
VKLTFLGGPYSGQSVSVRPFRYADGYKRVPFLVNVWTGRELHCYRTERTPSGVWYLFYRETF